ncbi:LysE family translocator [Tabrizicola sp. J26]|uniref:LysE family translocator n=1 Tax=Alitabrizicola rongguiensis TaxID=2909234 RepID=UPI001F327614|nr:LysE family translocator [Tabrizicola rongguiensis]MCF1708987.1 LysE family translocator [Tabrizicola rongguiensis]
MMLQILPALLAFAFVTSVTPGPNNMMLMASGANFGFRRTVPHMLGIAIGFTAMVFLVGVGLAGLFLAEPRLGKALGIVSLLYMLWLAWKITHAAPPQAQSSKARPLSFLQAAAFQWVNPKAWAMALSACALYAPDQTVWAVGFVALVFGAVNLPSVSVWAAAGQGLRGFLTDRRRLVLFNWAMAGLLVLSMLPALRQLAP